MELFSRTALEKATLAGGCFWCMTEPFEKLKGVMTVVSGYTGGSGGNPTYKTYGGTGHIEAVQITFNPAIVGYSRILDVYWRQIDPTDSRGQFCDRGPEYRPSIFYENDEQKRIAGISKANLAKSGIFKKPVTVEIKPASHFYPAEDYHQDYYKKNPLRYMYYRYRCGRDQFLEKVWGGVSETRSFSGVVHTYKRYTRSELKKKTDDSAVHGHPGRRHRAGLRQPVLE
ncbi:MAG: peptide-methionine (S)-S-oxide reductase MsrA [Chrysiogenales bacterium]|nr:MAG: peptide-methionine (S)-S-oxide reductase MsrA [Chrysiogenales bacterium]